MSLRLFWRRFHLWIGMACGLFLLTMALSGVVLLFGAKLDRSFNPSLYAVTGAAAAQPAGIYLAKAKAIVPDGEPVQLRWPEESGLPLTVMMRMRDGPGHQSASRGAALEHRDTGAERIATDHNGPARSAAETGARPRMILVYLDPPTGAVLGTADPRVSIVGWFRSLHEDLLIPAFGGRSIVGWNGIGLFVLCLTGVYLWWPRNAGFWRGLRWRRGPATSINLHHRIGFWIVLPLAVMAFTGIFQAFQPQGRAVMGMMMPVSAQPMRQGPGATPLSTTYLDPQQALDTALSDAGALHPALLALPTEANKMWRVQLSDAAGGTKTILIDDMTKAVSAPPPTLRGDALLAFMRRIHAGDHDGPVWQAIVLFSGLSPPLLFITGVMMWLRRRRSAAATTLAASAARSGAPSAQALDQDHIAA